LASDLVRRDLHLQLIFLENYKIPETFFLLKKSIVLLYVTREEIIIAL